MCKLNISLKNATLEVKKNISLAGKKRGGKINIVVVTVWTRVGQDF